jgi:hypothetical protein
MGQTISLGGSRLPQDASHHHHKEALIPTSPSRMGFAVMCFGVGGRSDRSAAEQPLPLAWDELLDWTEDASKRLIVMSTDEASLNSESTSVVRIIPFLRSATSRHELDSLPSMTHQERATFYARSVSGKFDRVKTS